MPLIHIYVPSEVELEKFFENSNSWDERDFKPMINLNRFSLAFSRTPFPLSFSFKPHINTQIDDHIFDPNCINICIGHNASVINRIPLTPWMLCHRAGHAIQTGQHPYSKKLSCDLVLKLAELGDLCFSNNGKKDRTNNGDYLFNVEAGLLKDTITDFAIYHDVLKENFVAEQLMTTRSAIAGHITDPFEIFPELISQYLIMGRIKLRKPGHQIRVNSTNLTSYRNFHYNGSRRQFNEEKLELSSNIIKDTQLAIIENEMNEIMYAMMSSLIGEFLKF